MKNSTTAYQKFIDLLVAHSSDTVIVEGIKSAKLPDTDHFAKYAELLKTMTQEQRGAMAELVQQRFVAGMQNTLLFLDNYRLTNEEGVELPHCPYGWEMHSDFIGRIEGEDWPNENEGL